jgi:hypothetical protein
LFVEQSKRFPDARPVLLLVSRDVPQWAKEHIYTNITAELAGTHHTEYIPGYDIHSHTKKTLIIAYIKDIDTAVHCVPPLPPLPPGVFIRMRVSASLGLDLVRLQTILASGCSVVADVDAGLTLSSRRQFLNALTIAKRALTPSPQVGYFYTCIGPLTLL